MQQWEILYGFYWKLIQAFQQWKSLKNQLTFDEIGVIDTGCLVLLRDVFCVDYINIHQQARGKNTFHLTFPWSLSNYVTFYQKDGHLTTACIYKSIFQRLYTHWDQGHHQHWHTRLLGSTEAVFHSPGAVWMTDCGSGKTHVLPIQCTPHKYFHSEQSTLTLGSCLTAFVEKQSYT